MSVSMRESLQLTSKEGVQKVILTLYLLHGATHYQPIWPSGAAPMTLQNKAHRMADIYKCLHQGTFGYRPAGGVKHIPNAEYFKKHLADDYYTIAPAANAQLLEPVTPDEAILRVTLRPHRRIFEGRDAEGFDMLEKVVFEI